jgi:hypothetical protein
MSTTQRNHAGPFRVPPHLLSVLRQQTLAVLEFNHHPFEDLRDLPPADQLAAAQTFRDAFAVLDAIGWATTNPTNNVDVPLSAGHVAHLRACQDDLAYTLRHGDTTYDDLHAARALGELLDLTT